MSYDTAALSRIAEAAASEVDRAILVLFSQENPLQSMSTRQIAMLLEQFGHPKINSSRLNGRLEKDQRCAKHSDGFRLHARKRAEVSELAEQIIGPSRPSIGQFWIDPELVEAGPKYVRNIVEQVNITHSTQCFDGCSVLIRRLIETLLIEAFENQGAREEIVDRNGDVMTLKHLIERAKSTAAFSMSRQTKNALPKFKDVGDWSAHNRRYLAKKSDLDKVHSPLRLAISDLGHLAGMH